jgi:copper transport protein
MNHRILIACLIALTLTGLAVRTASAHAYLLRSEPASGALLGQAPDQVKLWFDEPVELEFSQVQVIDANHARVDLGKLQYLANDHQAISAQLKPLPDGTYSVIWRVLSAADGHVTTGVFPFSVGNVAGSAPTPVSASTEGEPETSPVSVVTRWINLLATLTFVGGFFYRLFLLDRSARLLQIENERLTRNWQRLVDAAFIGALASAVVGLVLQASAVANVSFAQALAFDPLTRTLFNTNFGILWMIRNGALLAIDLLYLVIHRVTRKYLPPILGALALLTYSLGSHDAGVGGMFSALVLSDWLHLLAVAIWVGGLFHFLISVWTARRALADGSRG